MTCLTHIVRDHCFVVVLVLILSPPLSLSSPLLALPSLSSPLLPPSISHSWSRFVVELCELVSVRTLEIACFELFSSNPESFNVYSTDRWALG